MLSTAPGVFTSGEELKPSLLDDELIKDWLINYAPPTSISHPLDVTPVMNSPSPSPSFVALPQITEEQKKWGSLGTRLSGGLHFLQKVGLNS